MGVGSADFGLTISRVGASRREPPGLKWKKHGKVLRASTRMLAHLG
jgi:hypothetical protein